MGVNARAVLTKIFFVSFKCYLFVCPEKFKPSAYEQIAHLGEKAKVHTAKLKEKHDHSLRG